jgi:hypothetical protein
MQVKSRIELLRDIQRLEDANASLQALYDQLNRTAFKNYERLEETIRRLEVQLGISNRLTPREKQLKLRHEAKNCSCSEKTGSVCLYLDGKS